MPTATPTATRARVSLTPLPSLEDADLVRRARDGDDDAFEEIVRRYRAPLIRYSTRQVGRDHAEDITQHALASAAMHLREDPRPIHLRAWLYRVAHNAAINMRQRKDWGHEQISPDIDGVPQPPDVAAQRSEVRKVVSDLDRLPDRQRTALLLSVFEGLGYEEIAARLDTTPNSVRALLSRARVHLRRAAGAIAPVPLLQLILKKISGLAGAAGGQGTIAAGGTAIQANLVAVAATAVTAAGAATAQNAISSDRERESDSAAALVRETPVSPVSAVTAILIEPSLKLSAILVPPASKPGASPPPAGEGPAIEPVAPVLPIEPTPEVPAVEPTPPPPVDEAPPVEQPPAEEPVGDPPAPAGDDPSKDDETPDGEEPVDGDPVGDPNPPPVDEFPEDPAGDPPAPDPGESTPPETSDSTPPETGDSPPPETGDSPPPETGDSPPEP